LPVVCANAARSYLASRHLRYLPQIAVQLACSIQIPPDQRTDRPDNDPKDSRKSSVQDTEMPVSALTPGSQDQQRHLPAPPAYPHRRYTEPGDGHWPMPRRSASFAHGARPAGGSPHSALNCLALTPAADPQCLETTRRYGHRSPCPAPPHLAANASGSVASRPNRAHAPDWAHQP